MKIILGSQRLTKFCTLSHMHREWSRRRPLRHLPSLIVDRQGRHLSHDRAGPR